jgi:aminopeptidase N
MMKWLFVFTAYLLALGATAQVREMATVEKDRFNLYRTYDQFSVSSNNFDINYYRCEWTIDPAIRFIAGTVTSYFTITNTTNNIVFDLNKTLTVDSVLYHGNKIGFLQNNNNSLQVNLPLTLNGNQKDSVSIFYKGIPPGGAFVTTTHAGTPILWTLSEPYGAPTWWPCRDVLLDKADSIDILITYPVAYSSSSNGLAVSETTNGTKKTTRWKHRYPIASYLVAIAVTNYSIISDVAQLPTTAMPVVTHAYPESVSLFTAANGVAKFCLQEFSKLVTEYPFSKERYGQTQFDAGGGMEHQTNSFITSSSPGLVAHELAHQWFGDKATCGSWVDIWLNEGFATYMEYVYTELSGPAGKLPQLQGWRNLVISNPGGSVFCTDTLNEGRIFDNRLTYKKGGYLLHMLRWKLGDSTFFRGLRRYLNDPVVAYKNPRTADLQRNLEAQSGQSLTEFFKDWYLGEGYPNYAVVWSQQTNNTVQLTLNQTTSHVSVDFYEMPVPLQFKNAVRDTIITVNHTQNGQMFTVNPGFKADTVIIDPLLWILMGNKASQKIAGTPANTSILIYPNPVPSQLTITLPGNAAGDITVQLYNTLGQLLYTKILDPTAVQVDINTTRFADGVYWLRLWNNNGFIVVKKILVARK